MPNARATLAKLSRPRLHAPVKRTRLFKLLDERDHPPIVWVNGPPGAGKTTLVASYLEARKAKTFWYQVDEGDRDPATLFHYLAELTRHSSVRGRPTLPAFTADFLPDLVGFAQRYFRELFRQLGATAVLVLDNCQDAESDTFHLILRQACREIPPDCQLFGLSRSSAPSTLAREITNQRLYSLAWPQLRLSDDEATAIVRASERSERSGALLNRQCDGWVGGLVLLLARDAEDARSDSTRRFESREALFNYFAEEVFAHATPATQRLLLCTSLFPYTTVSMACELTTDATAGDILETLYQKQYFIDRKVEGELTYQYHDLFREFLLRQLQQREPQDRLASLRQQAAQILEHTGRLTEAVALFQQAQDWASVTRLIRAHAQTMLHQGRWQTLNAWFDGVPTQLILADPWLTLWRANARIPIDAGAAYLSAREAYAEFIARDDLTGELCAVALVSFLTYNLGAPFHLYDGWFARLEDRLRGLPSSLPFDAVVDAKSAYLGMAQIRTGRGRFAQEAEAFFVGHFFSGRFERTRGVDIGDLLLHQAIWPANAELGARVVPKLQALVQREDCPPEWHCLGMKDLGYWHFFNAEYAESLAFFDAAAALSATYGMPALANYCRCFTTIALCAMSELSRAEALLHQVTQTSGDDVFSRSAVNWAGSALAAARGNYALAWERASTASEQARAAGFTLLQIITAMPAAVYAVEINHDSQARAIVSEIRALTRESMWRFPHCWLEAMEVELQLSQGNRREAIAALRRTFHLAQNPRMAAFLVLLKAWLPRHFALALREDFERATIVQLIRRFDLAPPSLAEAHWPWPVRVRTLGAFEVTINDEPLKFSSKAPKKTLALLKAMIAFGVSGIQANELLDALWPDSESDAAHEALKITVLRLRKLLGSPDRLIVQEGRLSLNTNRVWVDVLAFEQVADRALSSDDTDAANTAVDLYRGSFLANEEANWPVVARERLRRKFVQLIAAYANRLEHGGEHAAAVKLYARGLDADNLAEQFYQGLMRCHLAQGRCAEGMDAFRRLRHLLSVTLSIAPSPESRALFETLQQRAQPNGARQA